MPTLSQKFTANKTFLQHHSVDKQEPQYDPTNKPLASIADQQSTQVLQDAWKLRQKPDNK